MSTVNATGVTYNEVNAALGNCQNGDTLRIPQGSATWTNSLVINKAVIIEGAGAGQTNITVGSAFTGVAFWTINNVASGGLTSIGNIQFNNGSYAGGNFTVAGFIRVNGSSTSGWQFRLHHCRLVGISQFSFVPTSVIGVVDHNYFDDVDQVAHTNCENWDGFPNGSGSWSEATNAGGLNCIVYEDNVCHMKPGVSNVYFDGNKGARAVIRHNTFNEPSSTHGATISFHGLENNNRSTRLVEIYDNLVEAQTQARFLNQRGGINIAFNNIVTGGAGGTAMDLTFDRGYSGTHWDNVWGGAYGDNKWDNNDRNSGPNNTSPVPYATITATAASGLNTIVVSGSLPNYAGYAVRRTQTVGTSVDPGGYMGGTIDSVTGGNTLNLQGAGGFAKNDAQTGYEFNAKAGETYQILRVFDAMDMVGRAGGSQIDNGTSAVPAGWNNQVTEGCWQWNNFKKTTGNIGSWGSPGSATTLNWSPQNPAIRSVTIGASKYHYKNALMSVANGALTNYPWNPSATATVGVSGSGPWGGQPASTQTVAGGDYSGVYPHPLVDSTPPSPAINSPNAATFAVGTTVNCASTPKANCHVFTTSNFTNTPTIVVTGTLPTGVTFTAPATLSGTAAGATATTYPLTITATNAVPNPDEVATQSFDLKIDSPNQPPTGVAITAPLTGATYVAPAAVTLQSSASDPGGSIVSMQYFYGGTNSIATVDATTTPAPYTYVWTGVVSGSYSLTVKATDNLGGTTTSSPINITVSAAPVLSPPTILVSA